MAMTHQQYSIYSSSQLRAHYAVIFWSGDNIRLTPDLSSVYLQNHVEEYQYA